MDVAIRRLAEHAGLEAVHADTGTSFEAIAAARSAEAPPHLEPDATSSEPQKEAA